MSLLEFLVMLVIAAVCGALGLPELFVLQFDDVSFPLVWSVVGSALFVAVLSLIARPRAARE